MLIQLSIKNIVLIESCDIALENGLCVLSGETGAGKSILLDALGLVLGARSDSGLVRKGEAQGSVSAEFDISRNDAAKDILKDLELEDADSLIIRRTIGSDGKTRCLVNDAPVTVAGLKKLGETLVEVHGQHDQKNLQDMTHHRALLDGYTKLAPQRKIVSGVFRAWRDSMQELTALKAEIERSSREQDYLNHMRKELKALAPAAGEEETLTNQRVAMMQNEKLFDILNEAISELNAGKGMLGALRNAQRTITRSAFTNDPKFAPIIEGLEKAAIEAEEALYALEKTGQDTTFNPEKLEHIEERLFALKAAGRKYNMPVDELAALYQQVEEKLSLIDSQEQHVTRLEKQVAEARKAFTEAAAKLTELRKKSGTKVRKSH